MSLQKLEEILWNGLEDFCSSLWYAGKASVSMVCVRACVCVCVCGMPGYADEMNPTNDPIAPNICLGSESERERDARGNCRRER